MYGFATNDIGTESTLLPGKEALIHYNQDLNGFTDLTFENIYVKLYDRDKLRDIDPSPSSGDSTKADAVEIGEVKKLTLDEMFQQANFKQWDFTNVWKMGVDSPVFKWQ